MDDTLHNEEQQLRTEMDAVLKTSPAAKPGTVDPSVAANIAATGIQAHPAAVQEAQPVDLGNGITGAYTPATRGSRIAYNGSGYKRPEDVYSPHAGEYGYGAIRSSATAPATQLKTGGGISDNGVFHRGGQTVPGLRIQGQVPGVKDTFYIQSKFNPVKPYPLTMANGDKFEVDTSNISKALYLYGAAAQPRAPVDFFGYNRMPREPEEGRAHAFFRNLVNATPRMLADTVGFIGSTALDAAEGVGNLIDREELVSFTNKMRPIWFDTVRDQTELMTWDYGTRSMGAEQNKGENTGFWAQLGSAAGSIPMAYFAGPAGYATVAGMEGAGAAYQIREALYNQGVPTAKAAGLAGLGGAGVFGLGMGPDAAERIFKSYIRPAGAITKLLKENPHKGWAKLAGQRALFAAFGEGLSETAQSDYQNLFTGEKLSWEDRLNVFLASALVGASSAALSTNGEIERVTLAENKMRALLESKHAELKKILDDSNGAITEEDVTEALMMIARDGSGIEAVNFLKEAAVANFDKLTPEDKKRIAETLSKFDSVDALNQEFAALDVRITEMLDKADVPASDKALMRNMLRGIAASRLVYQGVMPSQMELPTHLFDVPFIEKVQGVKGYYEDGGIAYSADETSVTKSEAATAMPVTVSSDSTANAQASARAYNEVITKGKNLAANRSWATGSLMHEFTHWVESVTGLTGVGEYMQAMTSMANSVIPGFLEGKSGVELSEAYAYAMQFADSGVKEALGLTGKTGDYMDFMVTSLKAQDLAEGLVGGLKSWADAYRNVLAANNGIINDMLAAFGSEQLRGSISSFVNGEGQGVLTPDMIRGLSAVLSTATDGETSQTVAHLFDGDPAKIARFMDKASQGFDRAMAFSDAKVKLAEQARADVRVANEMANIAPDPKDPSSPQTSEQQLIDLTKEDAAEETPATAEPTTESKPAQKKKAGTYDVDKAIENRLTTDEIVGYREQANEWLKPYGIARRDLPKYRIKVYDKPEGTKSGSKYVIETTPSSGNSEMDHKIAYAVLSEAKVQKAKRENMFSPAQVARLKKNGLYSLANPEYKIAVKSAVDSATERMASLVANGKATPAGVALYQDLVNYGRELDSIYAEYGPYTPVESAKAALAVTSQVIEYITMNVDVNPELAPIVKKKLFSQMDFPEQVSTALGLTNDPVGLLETLEAYQQSLIDTVSDIEAINADEKNPMSTPLGYRRKKANISADAKVQKLEPGKGLSSPAEYFTPSYNVDFSERFAGVQTVNAARAFLQSGKGSAEDRAKASEVISEEQALSTYRNPTIGVLKRDPFNTPTPLEEMGYTTEQARDEVLAAGLEPIAFNVDGLFEKALKNFNSADLRKSGLTRRTLFARLLEQIPSIGDSTDRAEQMRVLLGIQQAKQLSNDIFQNVLDAESAFDANPSLNHITDSAIEFYKSDRGQRNMKMHMEQFGYSEPALASDLHAGDEVAFPFGNNWFRAVVGFVGRTPSGQKFYVFQQAVDLDVWKQKKLVAGNAAPDQLVISAQELRQVGILRKPETNLDYVQALMDYSAYALEKTGRENLLRVAYDSMSMSDAARLDARNASMARIFEGIAESGDQGILPSFGIVSKNTMFAVGNPTVDPGSFVASDVTAYPATMRDIIMKKRADSDEGLGMESSPITGEEYNELMGGDYAELLADYDLDATRANSEVIQRMLDKQEANKPTFSESMNRKFNGFTMKETLTSLISAVKSRKHNKLLYFLGSGTSLDRKMRMLAGDVYEKQFNTIAAASRAQTYAEGSRHTVDSVMLKNVFNGSRAKYEQWLRKKNIEQFDAQLANGTTVKISRGEIISMKMAVEATKRGLLKTGPGERGVEARMRAAYKNFDELLGHLTEEDERFVDKVAFQALSLSRDEFSSLPEFWIPTAPMNQYVKDGWQNRKRQYADNSIEMVYGSEPVAALDAYDAIQAGIGTKALRDSGLMTLLKRLDNILSFVDVDRSQFKTFTPEDLVLFNELTGLSAELRNEIQNAIGPKMGKWLLDNVRADLQFNPAIKEIASNPALGAFQKLTRNVSAGLLSLSPKQALNNFGNYHLFLGLSDSSMLKFYTVDAWNAIAHIREAWALAMENPEFKRRLEQSGLSEQMRRVADMKGDSLLTDIQDAFYKRGKEKPGDVMGALNTLSNISVKYGLTTNVIPDIVGIALGNYAVYDSVLARNNGDVKRTQNEIASFLLNRASTSNYMTRSLATKMLSKMGLEAAVLFQNDQLQKWGMMAEAVNTLMNTQDATLRQRAWKDIEAFVYSTLRYVAIQAGWVAVLVRLMTGDDISDEEEKYLMEATLRETLSQIGGTSQFSNFITPVLSGIVEGRSTGIALAPYNAVQKMSSAMHKGDWVGGVGQAMSMSGILPLAPAGIRMVDGLAKLASDDSKEREVGGLMLMGRSEATAEDMLGYSRSQTTGKLREKKSMTREQKERRERKREAAREK